MRRQREPDPIVVEISTGTSLDYLILGDRLLWKGVPPDHLHGLLKHSAPDAVPERAGA